MSSSSIPTFTGPSMRAICCLCYGNLHKLPLWKLQRCWSLAPLGCTRPPKGMGSLANSETTNNSKVLTLLIIGIFSSLKFQIPITFSSENVYPYYIVIQKIFIDLAVGTIVLIFMAGCSYWMHNTKTKHNSLWSGQTRQYEPLSKHSGTHRSWSTVGDRRYIHAILFSLQDIFYHGNAYL